MPPHLGLVVRRSRVESIIWDTRPHDGVDTLLPNDGIDPRRVWDVEFSDSVGSYSGTDVGTVRDLRGTKNAVIPIGPAPFVRNWDDLGGTPDQSAIVIGTYLPAGVNTHPHNSVYQIKVAAATGGQSAFDADCGLSYEDVGPTPISTSAFSLNLDANDWVLSFDAQDWFDDGGDTTVQDLSDHLLLGVIDVTSDTFEFWIDDGTTQTSFDDIISGAGTVNYGTPTFLTFSKSAGADALKGSWPAFTSTGERRSLIQSEGDSSAPGAGTTWAAITGAFLDRVPIADVDSSYVRAWWSYF